MFGPLETAELRPLDWASEVRPNLRITRPGVEAPLVLQAVTKRWRSGQASVLDDVELTLEPGTSTWIGGRNGVGKTTLLRIVAGLIHPESGTARAGGLTVHEDRARYQRLVSFLPAGDRGLYARLTVRRHLEFWARIAMVPRRRVAGVVGEAIETFQLGELAGRRVDRISTGQRQRLRIAMTFLSRPQVVLLDEPLTSLDEEGVVLLREASAELRARGGAVLWCSPNVDHHQGSFDARWTLESGRLVPV
jgi:ABC-type multidrug transport system ATPase subunit